MTSLRDLAPVDKFLVANPQVSRELVVEREPDGRVQALLTARRCPGYYRSGKIRLMPGLFTNPGAGHSWPGLMSDRTGSGVLAHELGHHVHFSDRETYRKVINSKVWADTQLVTSYEKARGTRYFEEEAFAETFRLFLLNPDLLSQGRPHRFNFLVELGLKPVETRPWREVLADAPERFLKRVEPWLAQKNLKFRAQASLL